MYLFRPAAGEFSLSTLPAVEGSEVGELGYFDLARNVHETAAKEAAEKREKAASGSRAAAKAGAGAGAGDAGAGVGGAPEDPAAALYKIPELASLGGLF